MLNILFIFIAIVFAGVIFAFLSLKPTTDKLPLFHTMVKYHLVDRLFYNLAILSLVGTTLLGIASIWLPDAGPMLQNFIYTGLLLLLLSVGVLFLNRFVRTIAGPAAKSE